MTVHDGVGDAGDVDWRLGSIRVPVALAFGWGRHTNGRHGQARAHGRSARTVIPWIARVNRTTPKSRTPHRKDGALGSAPAKDDLLCSTVLPLAAQVNPEKHQAPREGTPNGARWSRWPDRPRSANATCQPCPATSVLSRASVLDPDARRVPRLGDGTPVPNFEPRAAVGQAELSVHRQRHRLPDC